MRASRPFAAEDTQRLGEALHELVHSGGSPGGVIICGSTSGDRHVLTAGVVAPECGESPPDEHTMYDVASLTKVVATWPLVGRAVTEGLMGLDAPIRTYLPFIDGDAPSGDVTVRQLLAHSSGLRAETRLDRYRNMPTGLAELMCREPLEQAPGTHRYINRGYILLGLALAHVHALPLQQLAEDLWAETGMRHTTYGPVARARHVAPTEQRLTGAPRIWGAPHDDNAALLGGVAGHAGVFSTPSDLAVYANHLLAGLDTVTGTWLEASLVPQADIEPGLQRGLSWILADGHQTAYHHGFTGTSLYLAPHVGRYVVVCTNAVYHGPARDRIAPLRALAKKTIAATF
ncbi:serine hydrolase domain-containing protein [Streptosporangium sp. NPDC002721]|uniref:serine hydrolase domain-containing protein n=1 Tax=Streptosporangium sp. NPDC002721 TaxID=3366188 RepID=UPI0036CA8FFD